MLFIKLNFVRIIVKYSDYEMVQITVQHKIEIEPRVGKVKRRNLPRELPFYFLPQSCVHHML